MAKPAHRILAIPISRNQFAFYINPITLSKPITSSQFQNWKSGKDANEKYVGFAKYQGLKAYERLLTFWDSIKTAKPESLKGRVYKWSEKLIFNRISPYETFMTNIELPPSDPIMKPLPPFKIVIPSILSHSGVEIKLEEFLESRVHHHKKWFFWSSLLLPITFILFLIPGPANFPLYINVFRSYCNWKAYRGGEYLRHLLDVTSDIRQVEGEYIEDGVEPTTEKTLYQTFFGPITSLPLVKVEYEDSHKLYKILGDPFFKDEKVHLITDHQIEEIAKEFNESELSNFLKRSRELLIKGKQPKPAPESESRK